MNVEKKVILFYNNNYKEFKVFYRRAIMNIQTVALIGEAEKGDYRTPYVCHTVPQLLDRLGQPPLHSRGIYYAIQALMYHCTLLFFRVHEEGFNQDDYFSCVDHLQKQIIAPQITAICLPGVGDAGIIEAVTPICLLHRSILIFSESDLYDYLTDSHTKQ